MPSDYYISCIEDTILTVSNSDMEEEINSKFPKFEIMCRMLSEESLAKQQINFDEFIIATTPRKYPGLIPDKHPKGICLPCCFDKYNTEGRFIANQKCDDENKKGVVDVSKNVREEKEDGISNENIEEVIQKSKSIENKKIEKNVQEQDDYIKGPDKFPLTPGRWGYLPVGIQKMLHEVNADCQISKTNTNIKPNHPCLLRHGIEVNKKQSFIACISDILYFNKNKSTHDKLHKVCKVCRKEERDANKKQIKIHNSEYYKENKSNIIAKNKDYHEKNKEAIVLEIFDKQRSMIHYLLWT
jgi:hypothetical protein